MFIAPQCAVAPRPFLPLWGLSWASRETCFKHIFLFQGPGQVQVISSGPKGCAGPLAQADVPQSLTELPVCFDSLTRKDSTKVADFGDALRAVFSALFSNRQ